jgi:predicted ribosome quality control (RQC) complex YloA/Tae2 family protein
MDESSDKRSDNKKRPSPPSQVLPLSSQALSQALSQAEVAQIALDMQALVGAQLQDCVQSEAEFALGFYCDRRIVWLVFDLHPQRPLVVRAEGKTPPLRGPRRTRPLNLFVKSRFLGRRLASVRADLDRGRLLILSFHRSVEEESGLPIEIEARLFPGGQNLIAYDGARAVAESKPKALPVLSSSKEVPTGVPARPAIGPVAGAESLRKWEEIEREWFRLRSVSRANDSAAIDTSASSLLPEAKSEKDWRRAIEKKEKALERMQIELDEKTSSVYSDLGHWLKNNMTLDVPPQWSPFVDDSRSRSWNIEECFRRAKENSRKAEGTRARKSEAGKSLVNLLVKAEAKGRRHKIGDDLEVYVGKSAADNLAILRRAQPFDYWLHLRERPGSHAILRRTRGRTVSDAELIEAGRWVIEQSTGQRVRELKGERFDLLIVECRFVRPIKGDRLGRVNYSNDRVIHIKL